MKCSSDGHCQPAPHTYPSEIDCRLSVDQLRPRHESNERTSVHHAIRAKLTSAEIWVNLSSRDYGLDKNSKGQSFWFALKSCLFLAGCLSQEWGIFGSVFC